MEMMSKKKTNKRFLDDQSILELLKDIRKRLEEIEAEMDQTLLDPEHDETPKKVSFTPYGFMGFPKAKSPKSVHNQTKVQDQGTDPFYPPKLLSRTQ